ncbi:UDP-glycosyltransferase 85A2-like [Phalaenopsis equestris]|uniref:UDP-glycosyltransferase 85A2-like n=1 Tax=Phalaenopsis equestris TaxID=78828 RepID=UPI0009E542C7|nr:UDP-glycosyltransferase 85A2-like [Phalaenopsis equestris]
MKSDAVQTPHAVCIPFPAQGHINPMLKLAKLLHSYNFHITFVLTDYNYTRLARSQGRDSFDFLPDFRFESIPDGLPISSDDDDDSTQDIPSLCDSTAKNCLAPFRRLISKLNDDDGAPAVSCIVSDGAMSFTIDAANELGVPNVFLWTSSASGYLAFQHYRHLVERGIIPLKDLSDLTNGYLDLEIDWIPGLMKGMKLKDFPSLIRTTDADDVLLNYLISEMDRAAMATAIVFNTFDDLEQPSLAALRKFLPPIYAVGPFSILSDRLVPADSPLAAVSTSLWKSDASCLQWLRGKKPNSVVFVSFGSITVVTAEELREFAWGLGNSGYDFVWVIRPDFIKGEAIVLPPEFIEETKERGMMVSWCAQEEILRQPSIGVFLTHCGWNSMTESLCGGVPMICWPFFSEQLTNCRYACDEWGVGIELGGEVKREVVEGVIREMMGGERGREMKRRAEEWKEKAIRATEPGGRSAVNLDKVVDEILVRKN